MDRRWLRGLSAVLAAGLLVLSAASAVAGASPDDTARLLAGMPPSTASPLALFTQDSSWQRHAKRFDSAWAGLETRQLTKIRAWSKAHIAQRLPVVYYMFSGPDFLYADAFFPDAATYVLSGLEPVGPVPNVEGLSRGALAGEVGRLQRSLNSVLSFSFFITKKMKHELRGGRLTGTLPILYVFLARAGKTIDEVSLITLDADGNEKAQDEKARGAAQGARIAFSGADGKKRTLYYFSTDVSDGGFDRSGFQAFCAKLGRGDALLKSASYLMHSGNFSKVRDFVLGHSDAIVQDDSGIPLRHFKPDAWRLNAFGNYLGPISIFPGRYQRDLSALYRRERAGPLDFGIGYRWRPRQSNLLLVLRGKKTAQSD
ncbi:MAG TPA: hypothetical protein VGA65_02790 [Hyphomicrobium sp.]